MKNIHLLILGILLILFACLLTGCNLGQVIEPTLTSSPTFTLSPTITPTITPTSTPSITVTPSLTPTSVPLSPVSKKIIEQAKKLGFSNNIEGCDNQRDCQAFINLEPYVSIIIYNSGVIIYETNDESTMMEYVKPDGALPPYRMEYEWYGDYSEALFYNVVTDNLFDIALIDDLVTSNGSYSEDTAYGYTLTGIAIPPNKIRITMEPNS